MPPQDTLADELLIRRLVERYRHLAYIQTRIGYPIKLDMPMLKGAQVQALYQHGARWLAGGTLER